MQPNYPADSSEGGIVSPFSDAEDQFPTRMRKKPVALWMASGGIFVVVVAAACYFLLAYLNDPLRTLEEFPVAKYLESHKAVAGTKFRGNLRVENDLGWKEAVGRVMVFTVRDDPRPIVVMVPASLASLYFVKGQSYEAELEVKEGGLIYANSCRKN